MHGTNTHVPPHVSSVWTWSGNGSVGVSMQGVIRQADAREPASASAFDRQKELFIAGLFRLLLASAHAGSSQPSAIGAGSSAAVEAEAARKLGFVPLCVVSEEAVQLSAEHQCSLGASPGSKGWDVGELLSWQAVLRAGLRRLSAAAEAVPRACAAWMFQTLPPEVLLLLAERVPVLDRFLLGAKRLAAPAHDASGWVPAAVQLTQGRADADLCRHLYADV